MTLVFVRAVGLNVRQNGQPDACRLVQMRNPSDLVAAKNCNTARPFVAASSLKPSASN